MATADLRGEAPAPAGARMAFVDGLKAGASQLIVLHHLAFYGPMSDAAAPLAPAVVAWLSDYARIAVQAFLVIGGFLAARAMAPAGVLRAGNPLHLVGKRYVRLVVPFAAALALAIALSALARLGMDHDSIPAPPGLLQIGAHLLLLHDLLDYDALTAGAWYVSIDLQLFVLLALALWLARAAATSPAARLRLGTGIVGGLALASLFFFNRDARWDESALYFFGAYSMGAMVWWLSSRRDAAAWIALLAAAGIAALLVDFRLRIAVALAVALALAVSMRNGWGSRWPASDTVAFLGRIGYSVFLVHFPIMLVVGSVLRRTAGTDPWLNALGIGLAWVASLASGALFHHFIERPATRLGAPPITS